MSEVAGERFEDSVGRLNPGEGAQVLVASVDSCGDVVLQLLYGSADAAAATQPDADQVAGETAAVDLVLAYLAGTVPAAPALSPLAADYIEQQASGLLSGAVMLNPDFALNRRAVMPPAGLVWLESVAMTEPVAATVRALAGDGSDRFSFLSKKERVMALAVSTAARLIALYEPAETMRRLHEVREVVSGP
ncbi:hypothetical protein ACIQPR_47615 [Streptomyces sp. NPDC091280]|uniref:hypothetical protein n=1 Tax=Streptomyces sp. NPDC091280 TaxID=3365984 RepID=UPI00382C639B